ncbi:PQQ-binding-like beta-propeller repeat protein [Akkermansiaceae bacterium]|nr:PQQ-binding-like beta-propeller repeat protein [Akkermansiaceae bacterium]
MIKSILISFALGGGLLTATDWTQWRGPTRDGKIHKGAAAWPKSLSNENIKLIWSADLGEGYSSPIIAGSKVFTVETKDKKSEVVRAFDRKTGKQAWNNEWVGSMRVPFYAAKNGSWVRCTPATDGKTLFVGGMRDVLVAIDVESGKEKWRRDYPSEEKTPLPSFGFVSSPLLDENHVYVQVGTALRKIKKSDGKTVWQSFADERAMFGSAFSSPFRANIQGVDQILVQTRSTLGGVLPLNGKAVWNTPVKAFRGMNILPPTPVGDKIFTATYGGGSFFYDVARKDKLLVATQLWNDTKREGYMSSPVVIGGKIYLHGRDKRFHCLDPESGKTLWSSDKKFGEYWSMVTQGNRILALDQRGILLHIDANPKSFNLLSEVKLETPSTWAHLAVCGDELYVRHLKGLNVYRWK